MNSRGKHLTNDNNNVNNTDNADADADADTDADADAAAKDKNDALENSVLTNNDNDSFASELNMSFMSVHNVPNMSNWSFNNIDRQLTSRLGAHKLFNRFQREAEQIKTICLAIWQPHFVHFHSATALPYDTKIT